MFKTYAVISFGNYETKILISNFINGKIFPVYKSSFLTKNCFSNSVIVDKELLTKILSDQIKRIPISLDKTILIFNLPIKKLNIKDNVSNEIIFKNTLTHKKWDEILKNTMVNKSSKKLLELYSKCFLVRINSNNYWPIPFNKYVEKISYTSRHYLVDRDNMEEYFKIANELKLNVKLFSCDSLVISHLFGNFERKRKLLLNIGHSETSFELYDNMILTYQMTCPFGIKNLTSTICESANIDEITSIELLKIYRNLSPIDNDLPLVNHFKERFLDYSQTKINDISALITSWIIKLINHINSHIKFFLEKKIEIDEIYIYSSTNIFNSWIEFIKKRLVKFSDVICLESKYIGVSESKFLSLIATMLHFDKEYKEYK
ncbi:hypothetical protein [Malacoplasma muris]|uniref:hypothetical protein n=1 Tax=Malacoplasma muris TaxID=2119 RepID=UPI00398ED0B1